MLGLKARVPKRFILYYFKGIKTSFLLVYPKQDVTWKYRFPSSFSSRFFGSNKNMRFPELHSCGNITTSDVGQFLRIRGFLQYQRMGVFAVLRDATGLVQILLKNPEMSAILKDVSYESYIEVCGIVRERPEEDINEKMRSGRVEIHADAINVLNKAKKDLPFLIRETNKIGKKMRDYLQDMEDFIEVTTPTLSFDTPGGAKEFIVPTQIPGKFFSLSQSPQIYKQLLMIGGFEKYFQFAVCYRDEGGERDRQLEFMQLDLEMINATAEKVKSLVENILEYSWPDTLPSMTVPFPSISYAEAMNDYGVDKPDTRFDWKIKSVKEIIQRSESHVLTGALAMPGTSANAFVIPQGKKHIKKSHIDSWEEVARQEAGLEGICSLTVTNDWSLKGPIAKTLSHDTCTSLINTLEAKPEDLIVLAVGPSPKILKLLGKLRLLSVEVLESSGVVVRLPEAFNFLWVEDFPLFETDELSGQLSSCHHPFTAPNPDDLHLLVDDAAMVRSQHYDLVLNGCEIGGGSIRIHDAHLQKEILKILNISQSPLQFFLDALECGAPPHGGIALGFDRYISILRRTKSIRDVIAFPKSSQGTCYISGAPMNISNEKRKFYHIASTRENILKFNKVE